MTDEQIKDLIKRRRIQMITSSYLYYKLDYSLYDDYQWTMMADELRELQQKYPELSEQVEWYKEEFRGWTGYSGFNLPIDEKTVSRAYHIMRYREKRREQNGQFTNNL